MYSMKEIEKKLHVQEGSPQDNRKNSPPLEGCPQDGVVERAWKQLGVRKHLRNIALKFISIRHISTVDDDHRPVSR